MCFVMLYASKKAPRDRRRGGKRFFVVATKGFGVFFVLCFLFKAGPSEGASEHTWHMRAGALCKRVRYWGSEWRGVWHLKCDGGRLRRRVTIGSGEVANHLL